MATPVEEKAVERVPVPVMEEGMLLQVVRRAAEEPRPGMTYEEFLAWADEDTPAEWVNGEVVMSSPASMRHRLIGDFLLKVVGIFVEVHGLGVVLGAPFQMKPAESGREPDLVYVAAEHLGRLRETHLAGPADLAVEIISPESRERDRREKFYEYERGGVREFWLPDPLERWFEAYLPDERVVYRQEFGGRAGRYESAVIPGFWLRWSGCGRSRCRRYWMS